LTAPVMQCRWRQTTETALNIVKFKIASGILCDTPVYSACDGAHDDLKVTVCTRMMRWVDVLILRCLIMDNSVSDMMETEKLIYRGNRFRDKLTAPGITMEMLCDQLQCIVDLEEDIMELVRKRKELAMIQIEETTS